MVLDIRVERSDDASQPSHHIPKPSAGPGWATSLTGWQQQTKKVLAAGRKEEIAGFRNPWPSFHKGKPREVWQALEWGEDADTSIELAASHLPAKDASISRSQQAAHLLQTEKPDFSFDSVGKQHAKTTWLGHAGVLLQLSPLKTGGRPICIIFDPIFSKRSSPSQYFGPIRSYEPPCKLKDLPPIDVLLLSHNHFDHLDYDTVIALWRLNKDHMRFIVPLKNAQWFIDSGIPASHVIDLDWWESAFLSEPEGSQSGQLKITCTPAQHSSGREASEADTALWSGWHIQHESPGGQKYRVFFAGDSGYQCHSDPSWPPKPPKSTTHADLVAGSTPKVADPDNISPEKYPPCPAYKEIAERLGRPDLVYLPVALGATWAYVRSWFSNYLPPSSVPIPRHSSGIAGAFHMPPWDAVRVLRDLTSGANDEEARPPVAVAIHWGTFVTEPVEVVKTLGLLEWACYNQDVRFGRRLENSSEDIDRRSLFVALNHGQSIVT